MKRKIVIEDFGKIGHCELELRPMMMFVGDNNSGKSYLMSLLWGLSTKSRELLVTVTPEVKEMPLYKECAHYLVQKMDSIEMYSVMPDEWCDKILYGKVEVRKPMGTSFLYKPEGQEDAYQMYLTSAVVTEITPLYLLCKYYDELSRFFIEEPEMCMHSQLQTAIARILIRMYNAGISVMATTHSDIIIQHINNMIRINKSSNKQELMGKFQLEKQDLISIENIGVYQFTCHKDGLSEIVELEAGELGFETPTFSNAFEKMLEVTYEI